MSGSGDDTFADLDLDLEGPDGVAIDPDAPRFRIDEELARGGLGRVHKGFDLHLQREVAIKQLLHDVPATRARFDRESQLTARLQHPNIVPIYDAGADENGVPYLAMRLVHGRSLHEVIAETRGLDDRLVLLPHVIAACNAVAYAHGQRICHRDLKPDNILVGAYGETVVIDWGLAKDLDAVDTMPVASPSGDGRDSGSNLTRAGAVMGTPAFMPPEQAAGRSVDESADVYALGAVLYNLLTGIAPYHETEDALAAVSMEPPRPMSEVVRGIPADLAAIVDKAMQRQARDRYRSAAELARDLERFEAGRWVEAYAYSSFERAARWVRRNRGAAALGALLGLTILTAIVGLTRANRIATDRADALAVLQREQQVQLDQRILEQAELLATNDPSRALVLLDELSADRPFDGRVHAVASTARIARPPRRLQNPGAALIERLSGGEAGVIGSGGTEVIVWNSDLGLRESRRLQEDVVDVLATDDQLRFCTRSTLYAVLEDAPPIPLPEPCWLLHRTSKGVVVQTEGALYRVDHGALHLLGTIPESTNHWVSPSTFWHATDGQIVARSLEPGLPERGRAPFQPGVDYGRLTDGPGVVVFSDAPPAQILRLDDTGVTVTTPELNAAWLVTGAWLDERTLLLGGDTPNLHVLDVPTAQTQVLPIRGRPYASLAHDGGATVTTDAGAVVRVERAGPHWVTRELGGSAAPLNRLTLGPRDALVASGRDTVISHPRRTTEGQPVAWTGAYGRLHQTGGQVYAAGASGTYLLSPRSERIDARPSLTVELCGGHRWILYEHQLEREDGHQLPLAPPGRALICSHDDRFLVAITRDDLAHVIDPQSGQELGAYATPGADRLDQGQHQAGGGGVVVLGTQAWLIPSPQAPPRAIGSPMHGSTTVTSHADQLFIGARAGEIRDRKGAVVGNMNAVVSALEIVDGQLIAGDYYGGIARWTVPGDPSTEERVDGHSQYVTRLKAHPSGRWVASAAWDGRVWIWDTSTRPAVGQLLPEQESPVFWLAWSEDGKTLFTADQSGVVRSWPHDVPAEPEALRAWVRERAGR